MLLSASVAAAPVPGPHAAELSVPHQFTAPIGSDKGSIRTPSGLLGEEPIYYPES
jgi:hypothetical protein